MVKEALQKYVSADVEELVSLFNNIPQKAAEFLLTSSDEQSVQWCKEKIPKRERAIHRLIDKILMRSETRMNMSA